MALTIQEMGILASGRLAGSTADIYTVPSERKVVIGEIKLVNNNSVTESVNIYVLPSGGTARRLLPVNMELESGYMCDVLDNPIQLSSGDKIQGSSTNNNQVDYVLFGIESTL